MPNQFLRLERFEEYKGRLEPPSGFAGGRVAYLDAIVHHYVPDEAVRLAGLETGQYHVAINVTLDQYPLFVNHPAVRPRLSFQTWPCANFNKLQGPMTDLRIRQAFVAAIDVHQVAAALGPPEFIQTDPGIWWPGTPWHSDAGAEVYYEYNPEKARRLLQEAGYSGQPIRWLVDPSNPQYYIPALVAKPMLEQVGFNIELVPVDSVTLVSLRGDPNRMDVFSCEYAPREPTLIAAFQDSHPGWWTTETKNNLLEQMRLTSDFQERYALFEQLQELMYTELPMMKFANRAHLYLESQKYSGAWFETFYYYYINTWLNE